ncbi:Peptidyl-prolyl cis-trans isomerase CWC27 like protein [Eufriesea mexicana]|uniref:Spliceosome-associated protein CWC27 homolog n=1 Tax=Eufriesea mexicana TaxID=516756 RepID=A0A310S6T3_9HYME|nr:Peptidyl-prolyl cis-trans isomerase CWC27 like protein [Eufriesea mexicana]
MKTTVGDVELELWAKETPKACRHFIQLCMEGTGEGGKIYGEPFEDQFYTRLRFCRRDLIAVADAGKNDNGSQFLFTLSFTPDLQNKHTIFGFSPDNIICNEKFCCRDFNLLSFIEKATEDEEESVKKN